MGNAPRVCEGCDCDDGHACRDEFTGRPCFWIDGVTVEGARMSLCSVCARIMVAMAQNNALDLGQDLDEFIRVVSEELDRGSAARIELATEAELRRVVAAASRARGVA